MSPPCRNAKARANPPPFDAQCQPRAAAARPTQSLLDVEMPQIRRGLVLLYGHQIAVGAEHIVLLADEHVIEVFGAVILGPYHRRQARIALLHRPWPRECVVD